MVNKNKFVSPLQNKMMQFVKIEVVPIAPKNKEALLAELLKKMQLLHSNLPFSKTASEAEDFPALEPIILTFIKIRLPKG